MKHKLKVTSFLVTVHELLRGQINQYIQLTEAGAYPQLPTQPIFFYPFQTYTAIYYGHSELSREEESKFD